MRVTNPSTWGCTVTDRRDFTVPMNSVVSSIDDGATVMTSTPIAGMPPGGPPGPPGPAAPEFDWQADRNTARHTARPARSTR